MSQLSLNRFSLNKNELLQSAMKALALRLELDLHSTDRFRVQQWTIGGQSRVYKVDLPDNRCVCLKLVGVTGTTIHLEREGYFLGILHSDHFPRAILNAACDGFVVEEWVEGVPFSLECRPILHRNLKIMARDLAQALEDLSATNPAILHRDIKPNNLRFRKGKVIVLDFGSAEYEGSRTQIQPDHFPKIGRGTHVFQPFEQLTSQPTQDRRVDVFAAASVIFAIMEGRPPYDNAQSGYMEALSHYKEKERELFQVLKKYSSRLRTALFDALRVDPEDRSTDLWAVVNAVK